mmetsp:Transcript_76716/g.219656  ORF Transcript_76716/g.219656 Transcript_76716/m.219656 type:complete len:206 (-) Transcript_76716:612-1229(-)
MTTTRRTRASRRPLLRPPLPPRPPPPHRVHQPIHSRAPPRMQLQDLPLLRCPDPAPGRGPRFPRPCPAAARASRPVRRRCWWRPGPHARQRPPPAPSCGTPSPPTPPELHGPPARCSTSCPTGPQTRASPSSFASPTRASNLSAARPEQPPCGLPAPPPSRCPRSRCGPRSPPPRGCLASGRRSRGPPLTSASPPMPGQTPRFAR